MTRDEFLKQLEQQLSCLSAAGKNEAIQFYEEAIDDRIEEGLSEEDAISALGTPQEAAEAILDNLPAIPQAIAKTKRTSTALLWILVILGSPTWLALLIASSAVLLSAYICLWTAVLCIWIGALALFIGGIAGFGLAIAGIAVAYPLYAVAMLGCGMAATGGTLLITAIAWTVTKFIAHLSVLMASKVLSLFRNNKRPELYGITNALAS